MSQWKVGDIVQLKSGGPVMTVTSIRNDIGQVACNWFLRDEAKNGWFPPEALEAAKK
jgi:uncharacterized protein YodC (DUF2158 family)